ncbi:MAG: SDR family NAD(P)-dependent oxidoreductase [Pseudomonadota bacterium]
MTKTILITGATDGIGFETAKTLISRGHRVLLHGRSEKKLDQAALALTGNGNRDQTESYIADLSSLTDVDRMTQEIAARHATLDVVINNAGVFVLPQPHTPSGHDLRFIVNTLAPLRLTTALLPLMNSSGRVINLSSAAQAAVDLDAVQGRKQLDDSAAYAQSKLALTMWTLQLAHTLSGDVPAFIAVNPGSFLASKMVKEAYGRAGKSLAIGADILSRAALSDEFASASGRYYDNDSERFADPHPDALNPAKRTALMPALEALAAVLNH